MALETHRWFPSQRVPSNLAFLSCTPHQTCSASPFLQLIIASTPTIYTKQKLPSTPLLSPCKHKTLAIPARFQVAEDAIGEDKGTERLVVFGWWHHCLGTHIYIQTHREKVLWNFTSCCWVVIFIIILIFQYRVQLIFLIYNLWTKERLLSKTSTANRFKLEIFS